VRAAATRLWAPIVLGLLPVVVLVYLFVTAYRTDSLAVDFHNELYLQAQEMVDGNNPYPTPDGIKAVGNFVWPPVAVLVAAPFTVLPAGLASDAAWVIMGLFCFAAALRVIGVRDWRVYGAAVLWVPVSGEIRTTHLTPLLCLLLAAAWRLRHRMWEPGLLVGVAIALKFFLWPMALWLACRRNLRGAALATALAAASLLLVLPFTGIDDYVRLLHRVTETYDQDGYTVFGLLVQMGATDTLAHVATWLVGATVIALGWRRQSFGLFVGAAVLLSPIVWIDYYALLIVPLAVVRPTFRAVWLLPIVTWGLPSGAGYGIGDIGPPAWVLTVFGAMLLLIARDEGSARPAHAGNPRRHLPSAAANG
jgi:glycosyl transferase family 87